jgi:hypothetical protein
LFANIKKLEIATMLMTFFWLAAEGSHCFARWSKTTSRSTCFKFLIQNKSVICKYTKIGANRKNTVGAI